MPPLVGVALKVTLVPAQIVLAVFAVMLIDGIVFETVTVYDIESTLLPEFATNFTLYVPADE